jgi:hypothetical protein
MIISDNENHGQLPPCGKKPETRVALLFLFHFKQRPTSRIRGFRVQILKIS